MRLMSLKHNIFLKILSLVGSRAIVFYLLVIALAGYFVDFNQINIGLKTRALNYMTPQSFDFLLEKKTDENSYQRKDIIEFIRFFKLVDEYMPTRADTNHLLGYCYAYGGNTEKAIETLKKAISINPNFFWPYHTLGVLYYQRKEYKKAAAFLEQAVRIKPEETLQFIHSSQNLYRLVLRRTFNYEYNFSQRISQGYEDAYIILGVIYNYLKNKELSEIYFKKAASIQKNENPSALKIGKIHLKAF